MNQSLELEQVGEYEFRVGQNIIKVLDDNILYIESVGEQTDELANVIRAQYKRIYSLFPGKVKQLVNINKSGKSTIAARDMYKEMSRDELTEKMAVYGAHPVARVLAAFVIGVSGMKETRFFKTEEEALGWLKE